MIVSTRINLPELFLLKPILDGYRTIAINQVCQVQENDKEEGVNQNKKKKKGETVEPVPLPYDLSTIEEIKKELNINDFKVFNRLTISFSRQENLHIIVILSIVILIKCYFLNYYFVEQI